MEAFEHVNPRRAAKARPRRAAAGFAALGLVAVAAAVCLLGPSLFRGARRPSLA